MDPDVSPAVSDLAIRYRRFHDLVMGEVDFNESTIEFVMTFSDSAYIITEHFETAARIAFNRSNNWLVRMNLATLALLACTCAFINFPYVIASYNVDHSKEVSGNGLALDVNYLVGLGPQAVPAIDRFLAAVPNSTPLLCNRTPLAWNRDQLIKRQLAELDSWRTWSFRGYRLKRYVAASGTSPAQETPTAAKGDKG